jgi:hypothetical protein
MAHIVLTEEQIRVVSEAKGPVEVLDPNGQLLASLVPFDAADIAALERYRQRKGKKGPSIPSERVQAFLRQLHDLEKADGLDETKVEELLRQIEAAGSA